MSVTAAPRPQDRDLACCTPFPGRVVAAGDLDLATAARLRTALIRAADDEAADTVEVDLSGVSFCDASGMSALVLGRRLARRRGKDLLLLDPSPGVLRVLLLTRLHLVFPVVHSRR